jgi:putative ABC transport system permease protein
MQLLWTVPWTALRNLLRQPRRSALALSAVTFGVVALMLASGFIQWIYFDLRESTIRAELGHLQIVRPGYYDVGRADPFKYLLPASGPTLDLVERQPGVVAVAPRLYFSGLASHGDTTISFSGEGISPAQEAQLSGSLVINAGAALREGDSKGVMFGAGLAHNLGVHVGDPVVLLVSTPSGGVNAVDATVRGIFSTVSKAFDDSALRVPIEMARRLLRVQGAHAWVVLLDDTARTDATMTSLHKLLPAKDFEIAPWYELADFYNKTVALFSKQLAVMRAIIAAIIVLSISNTMIMGVMERTGEIGTAMALGATRSRIGAQFVVEGIVLGILGGLVGVALSVALATAISAIGIPMPPPPGMAHGYVGQIMVTPTLAVQAFGLASVTTLIASIFPAIKASRLSIVDALRTNR